MDDYSRVWVTEKNGILYAIFRLNGKMKWERIGESRFITRDAINKKKKEITEKLATGEYIERKIVFDKMIGEFLEYAAKNRTEGTCQTALGHCNKLLNYFKGYFLTKITPALIEGYIDKRREQNPNISDKTIINELFTLSAIFKLAIKRDYLKENPVKRIEKPKYTRPEMKCFTQKEIELTLANCSRYLRGILLVGLTTGLRSSEICNLKWENISFEEGIISIKCDDTFKTKNRKNRLAVMVPQLRKELEFIRENWIDPLTSRIMKRQDWQRQYVFCHCDGRPVKDFSGAFEKLMKRLGIENASPHTMRHTFITYHERFGDPYLTQKMVGHSDQRMTQGYYHLQVERMKESMGPVIELIESCQFIK